ncbi:MAG: FAD-dependent thymidylate synthase [Candidatus Kerfeldbacteria bacterium]|nr:FAD-dependent thymidylate synthase [Candidatus Kerfeldbacteria bacterium]
MTPRREIYAIGGLAMPPEANAYGLARYSRSDKPAKETFTKMVEKILEGDAAMKRFFEVFYFQYGHASIADLAHVSMAVEHISMIAAMEVVDEQLWDGQERSTRYQHFSKDAVYTPAKAPTAYKTGIAYLMDEYNKLFPELLASVQTQNPLPKDYSESAYKGATHARAFDIARYLLPLASLTSVGQITSGRTLEKMISRLYSNRYAEVRAVADDLKAACNAPTFNPFSQEIRQGLQQIKAAKLRKRLQSILQPRAPLPTLVKYTAPIKYHLETEKDLRQAAKELLKIKTVDSSHDVQAFHKQDPLVEAVTTLFYSVTHYSYKQIKDVVGSWSEKKLASIYELGTRKRGSHDELMRSLDTHSVTFDILMDVGSYRDMHRHRRTIQVPQDYTYLHGYDTHPETGKYGGLYPYQLAMDTITPTLKKLDKVNHEAAVYLMPMGFKRRSLFKMGWNEIDYIGKLRTGPGRHLSYWNIALRMVAEAKKLSPARTKHIPTKPLSLDSVYER